ncbi:hypothetical protein BCR33DRAFT_862113 [Rhizoclosmatium globosum]|uniref:Uncharacterized protein n=1 Tax=Rhizoclosmatium globosum TaxID=329046 RepID=A0A1Y2AFL9_9FUNG|nr:hypothetical protein BCR33DRAFT_862113 [Rhizoclosmatium globosum]|eukprot:ORY21341.1 hypothetical protein BCR33DRAFT_862113 [Rhizoclosmatium globosum]
MPLENILFTSPGVRKLVSIAGSLVLPCLITLGAKNTSYESAFRSTPANDNYYDMFITIMAALAMVNSQLLWLLSLDSAQDWIHPFNALDLFELLLLFLVLSLATVERLSGFANTHESHGHEAKSTLLETVQLCARYFVHFISDWILCVSRFSKLGTPSGLYSLVRLHTLWGTSLAWNFCSSCLWVSILLARSLETAHRIRHVRFVFVHYACFIYAYCLGCDIRRA